MPDRHGRFDRRCTLLQEWPAVGSVDGAGARQHSSGGKQGLLGISKRGDGYLRALLIHGARAVLRHAEHKVETAASWLGHLLSRRNKNIAAVALANKNARRVWALLRDDERRFRADYVPAAAGM